MIVKRNREREKNKGREGARWRELESIIWRRVKLLGSVQFSSVTQLCPTLCDTMNCTTPASPSITNSRSSLTLTSIESVMPSSHLSLCRPLLLLPPTWLFKKISRSLNTNVKDVLLTVKKQVEDQ